MPLTDEEKAELKRLQDKEQEPDEPQSTRSRVENINYTVDLADEEQVKRAVRAGLLPKAYLEDDAPPNGDGDGDGDGEPPKRRARFE